MPICFYRIKWLKLQVLINSCLRVENVFSFLDQLASEHREAADKEVRQMKTIKDKMNGKSTIIQGWDRLFFGQMLSDQVASLSASTALYPISSYFSVGTVLAGISSLFESLYGIRFELDEQCGESEIWHSDVRKLLVVHETEGLIGTIYCDLFRRESPMDCRKYENPSHFTVRCSRRLDDDEDFLQSSRLKNRNGEKIIQAAGGEMRYQLPIVVLVTSFNRPNGSTPGLLELHEIETLFHEMGHAMHCKRFFDLYKRCWRRLISNIFPEHVSQWTLLRYQVY
jgi:intermediate peptidase